MNGCFAFGDVDWDGDADFLYVNKLSSSDNSFVYQRRKTNVSGNSIALGGPVTLVNGQNTSIEQIHYAKTRLVSCNPN
jgi:hypothetical protein